MTDGFVCVAVATPAVKVADCDANLNEIIRISKAAACDGAKLILFPELCITAYTCGDLFFTDALIRSAEKALFRIAMETAELDSLIAVGLPLRVCGKLYNCAALIKGGRILGVVPKAYIPNYGEYYELRYFSPAPEKNSNIDLLGESVPFGKNIILSCNEMSELRISAEICEDLHVAVPPSSYHAISGATVILNLSASNEIVSKDELRRMLVLSQSSRTHSAYLYSSTGNGESTTDLVFSGHCIVAEDGKLVAEKVPFSADEYIITEIDVGRIAYERQRVNTFCPSCGAEYINIPFSLRLGETKLTRYIDPEPFLPSDRSKLPDRCETILTIQAKGLAKRIEVSRAKKCVVAVSGGLDSCLALLVSARAMELLGRPKKDIIAVTMPCFGTTKRTKSNAEILSSCLETDFRCIDIAEAVVLHFKDIGHDSEKHDVVYENAQARQRTLVIMDIANAENGLVIGTGDLSELVLGWATYNGDHMSMYGVNSSLPKTLIRHIVSYLADKYEREGKTELSKALRDILATPVSPELLPAKDGNISQMTEDLVGPYELHDFHLYYMLRYGFSPRKLLRLSEKAFGDIYDRDTRLKWLEVLTRRFFAQQFKRSCLPDGPKVCDVAVSPRGDLRMPSDAACSVWLDEIEKLKG